MFDLIEAPAKLNKTAQAAAEKAEMIERLQREIPAGSTVYTVLRHVSSTGMSRVIGLIVLQDNEPRFYGYHAAKALGWSWDGRRDGVKVGGCGMDMGFHLVYSLSRVLHGDGYALNHRWL
jgi:hypothetical protein